MLRSVLRGKKKSDKAQNKGITYEDSKELARSGKVKLRRELASNRTTKPEVLYFLAEDKSADVRRETASNTKCPSGDFMSRMNRLSGAPS